MDITADPTGLDRLVALGARTAPVVAIGNDWIGGATFDRLDDFFRTAGGSAGHSPSDARPGAAVGNVFCDDDEGILDEEQLVARLDTLLEKTIAYIYKLPLDILDRPLPVRGDEGRTVRGLAFHTAQVARDPVRAAEGVPIVKSMHEYDPPADLQTPADLARTAGLVREQLQTWWSTAPKPPDYGVVDYFQGPYTFHGLLERSAWHVATHLRQLAWILVDADIDPVAGLSAADSLCLPIPPVVWK